eukprot:COSAG02_NODE_316_length_24889_cov_9.418556_17_plen_172_part_00
MLAGSFQTRAGCPTRGRVIGQCVCQRTRAAEGARPPASKERGPRARRGAFAFRVLAILYIVYAVPVSGIMLINTSMRLPKRYMNSCTAPSSAYCMSGRPRPSFDGRGRPFSLPTAGTPRTLSVLNFPTNLVQGPRGHHPAALYQLGCVTGNYCVSGQRCRDRVRRGTTLRR